MQQLRTANLLHSPYIAIRIHIFQNCTFLPFPHSPNPSTHPPSQPTNKKLTYHPPPATSANREKIRTQLESTPPFRAPLWGANTVCFRSSKDQTEMPWNAQRMILTGGQISCKKQDKNKTWPDWSRNTFCLGAVGMQRDRDRIEKEETSVENEELEFPK